MASRSPPYCLLKVDKVKCCDYCKGIILRALMKIRGVNLVTCDEEEELVYVNGKVDPGKLMEVIELNGGKAKLVECINDAEDDDDGDNGVGGARKRQCCREPSLTYHPAAMPQMQFHGSYGRMGGGGGYVHGMMPPHSAQNVGGYNSVDERCHGLDPKYFYGQDHPL